MKCCLSFSPSFWSGFKALSLAWTREHIGFLKVAITMHLQSVSEPSETFSGCVVHRHYSVHASRVHHCEPGILKFRHPCCCCQAISLPTLWWYSPLHHFPSQQHWGGKCGDFSKIGLPFDPQLVKDGHKPNANLLHGWEWEVLGQVLGSRLLPWNRHMEEHRPGKVFNFLTFSSPRPDVHHALVF